MPYKGHVENGVIIIDEPAPIEEGLEVRIEIVETSAQAANAAPLRGASYRYEEPFAPAVSESEWESNR